MNPVLTVTSKGKFRLRAFLFHRMLKPGGLVLIDVYSLAAFEQKEVMASYAANLLDGFWSPDKHDGFLNSFKYDEEKVSLDKYTII